MLGAQLSTDVPGYSAPLSLEEYKAEPNRATKWPDLVLLPKGTRFRLVRLERRISSEYPGYNAYAEIVDGEYKARIVQVFVTGYPKEKGSLRSKKGLFDVIKEEAAHFKALVQPLV